LPLTLTLALALALPWAGMIRPFRAKKIVQLFCVASNSKGMK